MFSPQTPAENNHQNPAFEQRFDTTEENVFYRSPTWQVERGFGARARNCAYPSRGFFQKIASEFPTLTTRNMFCRRISRR
jgi:hypothetical protein